MIFVKIRLDTLSNAKEFVEIASKLPGQIVIRDNTGMRVNAKSLLGMLYAMEFEELYCESENDIYSHIEKFIVI